ncbi:hypothetical protein P280DRAFT_258449 [Massarina eburnea CBS 473.64]|uniref:Uncharacterized protein n=1 Tax=Massarina eburnea CBS 473.64 TaxID=1395130 RepID=A0A6A6RJ00_9PLEO|nr:hypothetical protein P280DRAFT_258449 [Massarina eburnea CBS 473.64]
MYTSSLSLPSPAHLFPQKYIDAANLSILMPIVLYYCLFWGLVCVVAGAVNQHRDFPSYFCAVLRNRPMASMTWPQAVGYISRERRFRRKCWY